MPAPTELPMRSDGLVVAVIETPRGSGNKLKFDEDLGVYRLDRVLPAGMLFPFDFGFVPQTVADDGDPLDVIVLLDTPVHPGCVVLTQLIGIIEGNQKDKGQTTWERNDRLLAVAGGAKGHAALHSIDQVDPFLLQSIESFFATYHALDGDTFRIKGRYGAKEAERALDHAHDAFEAKST